MKKNNKRTTQNNPVNNPRSKLFSESISILLILLGIVFLVSLFTYSEIENPLFTSLETPVKNSAGIFGAYLSDTAIVLFGYTAYILPISLIWLGFNFHRSANDTKQSSLSFIFRLIAFFIMLFFAAALAHIFRPDIEVIPGVMDQYPAGGWVGESMHEYLFGNLFGDTALLIYIGIILASFSIATSASWKNISISLLNKRIKRDKAPNKTKEEKIKPEIIGSKRSAPQETKSSEKPQKMEKSKKQNKPEKPKQQDKPQKDQSSNLFKAGLAGGLPDLTLLDDVDNSGLGYTEEFLVEMGQQVEIKLKDFGFDVSITAVTPGPVVTQFEISLAPGIKVSQIMNLNKDLARALLVESVRIVDVIPGKPVIGLEIPNNTREMIGLKEILSSDAFTKAKSTLSMGLGKDINGQPIVVDLAKMPHLLMAGATGQGKSVGLNAILVSLLYKKHPSQIKFVLVDPKKVELTLFNKIERHYLAKLPESEDAIITDTKKVINTVNSLCIEMDDRYEVCKTANCRNIKEYNAKFISRKLNPNKGHRYLPYIVLVIDEFADLIMTAGKEIETPIARLAQLARAIGIHLIVATQRPSVNVITGIIKANFPARVAFRVTSNIDSRTIMDTKGADQLIGMGDMLISTGNDITRLQCAFIDTPEVEKICEYIGSQRAYPEAHILPEYEGEAETAGGSANLNELDVMFNEAASIVVQHQSGSTSLIQRKLRIGYNRAGSIIDQLETAGIVGPFEGSKARKVLIRDEITLEELLSNLEKNA